MARYNRYRKRHYNISKTKARNYAEDMESLYDNINSLEGWSISTMLDSAYNRQNENYTIRLSNHSADNRYHDLHNGHLLVNIKSSKLEFISKIHNELSDILKVIDSLELDKYRFINVVGNNINCYLKGFKTKKEVIEWRE